MGVEDCCFTLEGQGFSHLQGQPAALLQGHVGDDRGLVQVVQQRAPLAQHKRVVPARQV